MIKRRAVLTPLVSVLVLGSTLFLFQNCSGGQFDQDNYKDSNSTGNNTPPLPPPDTTPIISIGTGPTITIVSSDVASPALPFKSDAKFDFIVADTGNGVTSVTCSLDGGPYVPCSNLSVTYTGLTVGTHTFRIRALDTKQNASQVERTWTVAEYNLNNFASTTCTLGIQEYYDNRPISDTRRKGMDFYTILNGFPQYSVGKFVSQVRGTDSLRLTAGSCRSVDLPMFEGCTVSLGHSDGNAKVTPDSSISINLASMTAIQSGDLFLGGSGNNVDGNDKLYIRMNCAAGPAAYQNARQWVQQHCQLCLGHSNNNSNPTPSGAESSVACTPVRDASDMTWAPLSLLGSDVDDDNRLHLRFYCQ